MFCASIPCTSYDCSFQSPHEFDLLIERKIRFGQEKIKLQEKIDELKEDRDKLLHQLQNLQGQLVQVCPYL